jgi:hypothetical protein
LILKMETSLPITGRDVSTNSGKHLLSHAVCWLLWSLASAKLKIAYPL